MRWLFLNKCEKEDHLWRGFVMATSRESRLVDSIPAFGMRQIALLPKFMTDGYIVWRLSEETTQQEGLYRAAS
jgi:hypothetical protein